MKGYGKSRKDSITFVKKALSIPMHVFKGFR